MLANTKDTVSQLESSLKNTKSEKELLEQGEQRMSKEIQALLTERSSQNNQLTSLLQIQNEMKRSEAETRSRLSAQVLRVTRGPMLIGWDRLIA